MPRLPFGAPSPGALLDADMPARAGAKLFLLARGSDGPDATGREGFFGGGGGIVSVGSAAPAAVLVLAAFEGEPTPKFHTLRTIDLAEDKIPKRGVALPLSARVGPISDPHHHQVRER